MLYPDFNELVALKKRKKRSHQKGESAHVGGHLSPFRGQGLEFDAVRGYVPGDDIRYIDWRVTARKGSPHLKIFRAEREFERMLCVDMNASMRFGTKNTFKSVQAAHAAALLGWEGIGKSDRVGACLYGDVKGRIQFFPPTRTEKGFYPFLNVLSGSPQERHLVSFEEVLEPLSELVQTGTILYCISDFFPFQPNEQALSRICKKCRVVFIAIEDPFDRSLFLFGTLGFIGKEKIYIDTKNSAGRKAYEGEWKENRTALWETANRFKIPLIELSTESDVYGRIVKRTTRY